MKQRKKDKSIEQRFDPEGRTAIKTRISLRKRVNEIYIYRESGCERERVREREKERKRKKQ